MFKLPRLPSLSSKKTRHFLALDIGTDYVKCLVFEVARDLSKFLIVGHGKQPLSYLSTRGGAVVDYSGVREVAKIAVDEALSSAGVATSDVIIGVSGEMTKGLVTTVRLTRPTPEVPISDKELSMVVGRIHGTAYVEATKEIVEMTGNPDLEIELTNSSISWVKIDDDFVKDPLGMTGKRMEVALFTAFSPSFHLKLMQRLAKELRLKILVVTSNMYSLSKSLISKDDFSNLVLVDIGGETTDVGVVFGGGLAATRTLSLGGRHITRAISEAFSLSFVDAEEKKLRFSLGTLNQEEDEKVRGCVKTVLDLWVSGLEVLFSDFNGIKTFPAKIMITGGGSALKGIEEILRRDPWAKNIQFKEPPSFERVGTQSLLKVSDMTGKSSGYDDVMPASLSEVYLELNQ